VRVFFESAIDGSSHATKIEGPVKLRRGEHALPERLEGEEPSALTDEERAVRCAACGARVTRNSSRTAVNGAHEHAFMNPSGIHFTVQCFAEAAGCRPEGPRSAVWTWFPGFEWQIELCRACGVHLGWSFHGPSRSFYGLVTDRLAF
jgi:hypothetical protein